MVVKAVIGMTMYKGCPKVHIWVVGLMEEGNRIVKVTKRGIRTLQLEVQDGVVVESVAEDSSMGLEKVVD